MSRMTRSTGLAARKARASGPFMTQAPWWPWRPTSLTSSWHVTWWSSTISTDDLATAWRTSNDRVVGGARPARAPRAGQCCHRPRGSTRSDAGEIVARGPPPARGPPTLHACRARRYRKRSLARAPLRGAHRGRRDFAGRVHDDHYAQPAADFPRGRRDRPAQLLQEAQRL